MRVNFALGLDLGGTNAKAVLITPRGKILAREQFPTDETAYDWKQRIRDHVERIQREHGPCATWVGVASPGLAASNNHSIWWMQGRMNGVEGLNWTRFLKSKRLIPVLNDAHAALLGEAWLGAAKGQLNAVLLTLGTGVGGAILENGRLLQGALGRAGHLGHISLNSKGSPDIVGTPGSLEGAIGNCTIAKRSGGRFTDTTQLVVAHRAGDRKATDIWLRSVKALATGIASLINVTDPEVVILGGGIAGAGDALFRPLRQFLDTVEWRPHGHRVRIVRARLGEWAGALGAAHHAILGK